MAGAGTRGNNKMFAASASLVKTGSPEIESIVSRMYVDF